MPSSLSCFKRFKISTKSIINQTYLLNLHLTTWLHLIAYMTKSCWPKRYHLQNILTQVNHLIFKNCFSKLATNLLDFSILKIWAQSVDWLKSSGQKVNFLLAKSKLFGNNFWTSGQIEPKFWVWKNLQNWGLVCKSSL